MARTRLFAAMTQGLAPRNERALSRRGLLTMTAAMGVTACAPRLRHEETTIGVVGGGIAGLTAAYRLARAGHTVSLYEASSRFGGRMFTKPDFNAEGMFCELGGELVDSNHLPLMALAKELGVGIQPLKDPAHPRQDLYLMGGAVHAEQDLLHARRGLFAGMAKVIARDAAALTDAQGNWTDTARRLDGLSVAAYLKTLRPLAPDWVTDLLDLAYLGEYGVPTDRQSALNLVDLIAPADDGDYAMFGKSDEAFRIQGGSSALPDALVKAMPSSVHLRSQCALTGLHRDGNDLVLDLTDKGERRRVRHSHVVLALPFTTLRQVAGLDQLGLSPLKHRAIAELGYGDNAKIMVGTTSRPWLDAGRNLPAPANGEFYARDFQVIWDTSRAQNGHRGILTNFVSGVTDQAQAVAAMQAGLQKIWPPLSRSLDLANQAAFFWAANPYSRGAYSAPLVGQYTTLLEAAGTPELDGRLLFCGEHTSVDFPGFMCGGVDTGEKAAKLWLAASASKP